MHFISHLWRESEQEIVNLNANNEERALARLLHILRAATTLFRSKVCSVCAELLNRVFASITPCDRQASALKPPLFWSLFFIYIPNIITRPSNDLRRAQREMEIGHVTRQQAPPNFINPPPLSFSNHKAARVAHRLLTARHKGQLSLSRAKAVGMSRTVNLGRINSKCGIFGPHAIFACYNFIK